MKAKTEELLYLLLWTCDTLSRPTFRNLTESFEGWTYRKGFRRQLERLEREQLLESQRSGGGDRFYQLTEAGRALSLGGRDPEAAWSRKWDGRWRLVLFDFPLGQDTARDNLRRHLRSRGFGYLQNSVWITPDPLTHTPDTLASKAIDVESLILFEARPCAGETDEQVVAGAWNFPLINQGYERHLEILAQRPSTPLHGEALAKVFQRWARQERGAWQEAVSTDPLLPERLLPANYVGRRAWRERVAALTKAAEQIRSFKL